MRDLKNANTHCHPAFLDALELIERWVRSENEQPLSSVKKLLQ